MKTPRSSESPQVMENFHAATALESVPPKESLSRNALDALEESEASYRYLFESNPHPMWICNSETLHILTANNAAIEHYGYSMDEFLTMTLLDIRPVEDRSLLTDEALRARVFAVPNNGKCGIWRQQKKSGEIIDVEVTIHTLRFQGKASQLVLLHDVTEQKRIERALQQSEQEQRLLAEHLERERERLAEAQSIAKVGSWELNLTTNAVFWSEETYRIFGMDPLTSTASFEAFVERIHPDDRADLTRAYTTSVANRIPYAIDHRMQMADGSIKIVHESCKTVYDAAGRPLRSVGTIQDITDHKQAEEERDRLFTAKQNADAANQAKSEFLSRMSHELRTPLNAILGFGQILDKEPLTPLQKESVQYVLKGGRHLLELINEVLDISRVETGHMDLSVEPIALAEIISEACALVRPLAAECNILLGIDLAALGDSYILADRQRLKQALINLLSNAIKYNRIGGQVRVFGVSQPDDRFCIAIRDTGLGLTREEQQRLFIPFERLNAASSGIEGTGLGLVIAQRLITAMGGSLTLESLPGEGTTFFIELPQAHCPVETFLNHPIDLCESKSDRSGEPSVTILYIEDNLSNMRLLEVILRSRPGVTLLPAMQGSVGLDLASRHEPDLILLDLNLPDISGREVLARLQATVLTRDIPVIVLSADATISQIERLKSSGARAYLTKPLDVTEFLHTLDTMLIDKTAGFAHSERTNF